MRRSLLSPPRKSDRPAPRVVAASLMDCRAVSLRSDAWCLSMSRRCAWFSRSALMAPSVDIFTTFMSTSCLSLDSNCSVSEWIVSCPAVSFCFSSSMRSFMRALSTVNSFSPESLRPCLKWSTLWFASPRAFSSWLRASFSIFRSSGWCALAFLTSSRFELERSVWPSFSFPSKSRSWDRRHFRLSSTAASKGDGSKPDPWYIGGFFGRLASRSFSAAS
mmetsp:Transcript_22312/g.37808  ORF Transcript_22312/g.37808 Transcript_22312/m.37808 type:complete len:219 (-) Transcript_22312:27-683(-)